MSEFALWALFIAGMVAYVFFYFKVFKPLYFRFKRNERKRALEVAVMRYENDQRLLGEIIQKRGR